MQKEISLRLTPGQSASAIDIRQAIADHEGCVADAITGYYILKQSIDARSRNPVIQLRVKAFLNEAFTRRPGIAFAWNDVHSSSREVLIAGAGPAGLFAALKLLELGIRPIIVERGKDVRSRRRDLAALNRLGEVNPDSNYCFGEGGAGTYSDGKLYTRSTKRGDVNRILQLFVHFGADENILYEAHPHIGTNKLPHIITAMRLHIEACGGRILFNKKLTSLLIQDGRLEGIQLADGDIIPGRHLILATGHSARDIFELLQQQKLKIEFKPFALGVRVEHPQELIDSIQYHCPVRDPHLPPAAYSLVDQANGQGVFSFCMCPGGIIAPAATSPGEIVVNGWSPSKRNNPFANSGIVVTAALNDIVQFLQKEEKDQWRMFNDQGNWSLAGRTFQQSIEQKAFAAGGGKLVAPASRLVDFCNGKISSTLPECSYLPGITAASLDQVLPPFIYQSLAAGFRAFGQKMKGYFTNEAVVVATESRTSSPVTIPRDAASFQHPDLPGLFPCGEGAGYAGGIVSAAMDGERVAAALAAQLAGKRD